MGFKRCVRKNKAVQSERFGPFYDVEENQRDHIALELELVSVYELGPCSGPVLCSCSALLALLCFSPWLDYRHCVRLLNELEDLFVFLGLPFRLSSGSHWKVSTAYSGKASGVSLGRGHRFSIFKL